MKKVEERRILDQFRECFAGVPSGQIIEDESPDFRINSPNRRLGIEVTRIFHPTPAAARPMQAYESLEDEIIRQAEAKYNEGGGPKLVVAITLIPNLNLPKSKVASLALRIAELVRESLPAANPECRLQNRWHPEDRLPREIVSLTVLRPQIEIKKPHWFTARAGWVWSCTPAEMQAKLNEKAKKAAAYRANCDELWLLMAVSSDAPSKFVELAAETREHKFTCPFDRVFFFESLYRRVHELKIHSSS